MPWRRTFLPEAWSAASGLGAGGSGWARRPGFSVRQQLSLVTEKAARLSLAEELAAEFGGEARELSLRPNEEERKELLRWASGGTSIVAGTLNATVYPEQLALLEDMAKLAPPMACVALRGPFELELLPDSVFRIPVYEYSRRGIRQVCRYLER